MHRALGFKTSGFNDTWLSFQLWNSVLEHNFTVFSDYRASFYNIALALPMILFDANLLGELQPLIITLCLEEMWSAFSVQACVWGEKQEGRVQLHGTHWVQRVPRRTGARGWGACSEPWSLGCHPGVHLLGFYYPEQSLPPTPFISMSWMCQRDWGHLFC